MEENKTADKVDSPTPNILDAIGVGFIITFLPITIALWWPWVEFGDVFNWLAKARPWVLFTGVAATPSLILTWIWREKHKRKAELKAKKDIEIAQESLCAERYQKAIELLGSDNVMTKVGAIYSLEYVSRYSLKNYWAVMDIFASYLRKELRLEEKTNKDDDLESVNDQKFDVMAIMSVLKRRFDNDRRKIALQKTLFLHNIDFYQGCYYGAYFENTSLLYSNFANTLMLHARFLDSALGFTKFYNASLCGAEFRNSDIYQADFSQADLIGADLSFAKEFENSKWKNAMYNKNKYYHKRFGEYFNPTQFPENFNPEDHEMACVD